MWWKKTAHPTSPLCDTVKPCPHWRQSPKTATGLRCYPCTALGTRILTERHCVKIWQHWVSKSLTVSNPVASHIAPESSIAPVESVGNYLFHHCHIKVDGVVEKQGEDRTLYTENRADQKQKYSSRWKNSKITEMLSPTETTLINLTHWWNLL